MYVTIQRREPDWEPFSVTIKFHNRYEVANVVKALRDGKMTGLADLIEDRREGQT